ncbi:MAG: phosphatase PAP2 family protein [Chloroflexota bacterium]|nr:phosphatase PAP2 family protein [Chloroflexota bacterium]
MYQAEDIGAARSGHDNAEVAGKPRRSTIPIVGGVLWLLAVALMVALAFFAHTHPHPIPFELATSRAVQALPVPPPLQAIMRWFTSVNDPIPDSITVVITVAILALLRKFMAAAFLALSAGLGNLADALIGDVVGRPRPSPGLIHVDSLLKFNSFPSGHSCHMMVFYGFLLYLSLTPPVRQWKYHLWLLPLQIYAVVTILIVGFARIWEGEHWITDVAGGYLDGIIWMVLFIFLYNLATRKLREHRAKKAQAQSIAEPGQDKVSTTNV